LKTPPDSRWLSLDANWEATPAGPASRGPTNAPRISVSRTDRSLVEAQEYRVIGEAIKEARGGIRRAAGILGMSPQSLLRRLEKWPELRPGGS
jgi:DNA-binding NtrC family response regulator